MAQQREVSLVGDGAKWQITNLRQVMKAALRDHMAVDPGHIDTVVFPQSADAKPFDGLFLQT